MNHDRAVADQEPWWITNYRGRGPLQRYSHHNPTKTRRSIDFYIRHLGLEPDQTILDLCCAFGRHARALIQCGFPRAVGVDLSSDMLAHATSQDDSGDQTPRFVRADVRALPFGTASADAALLLRSFGFLDTTSEDFGVLAEVARVLRPGGFLGMDHFPPSSATTKASTRVLKGPAGTTTVHTAWDPVTARVNTHMSTHYEDGCVDAFRSSSRLYTPGELRVMLAEAGFVVQGQFGGYDGSPVSEDSARCVVIAQRV